MRNVSWFVKAFYVNDKRPIADQLRGYLRGQWIIIRGMKARIVNVVGSTVVLWMKDDKMTAVFS